MSSAWDTLVNVRDKGVFHSLVAEIAPLLGIHIWTRSNQRQLNLSNTLGKVAYQIETDGQITLLVSRPSSLTQTWLDCFSQGTNNDFSVTKLCFLCCYH